MFKESFGFPWESWNSLKPTEEYMNMSLDEQINYLRHRNFGDNPDENNPAFKYFDAAIKILKKGLEKSNLPDVHNHKN